MKLIDEGSYDGDFCQLAAHKTNKSEVLAEIDSMLDEFGLQISDLKLPRLSMSNVFEAVDKALAAYGLEIVQQDSGGDYCFHVATRT